MEIIKVDNKEYVCEEIEGKGKCLVPFRASSEYLFNVIDIVKELSKLPSYTEIYGLTGNTLKLYRTRPNRPNNCGYYLYDNKSVELVKPE